MRPCMVISSEIQGKLEIVPLSSALDLYRPGLHFLVRKDDPDFPATGLLRTSFIAGDQIREVEAARLVRRAGRLEGNLAGQFELWMGS